MFSLVSGLAQMTRSSGSLASLLPLLFNPIIPVYPNPLLSFSLLSSGKK